MRSLDAERMDRRRTIRCAGKGIRQVPAIHANALHPVPVEFPVGTHRQKTQQSDRAFDPYQILGIPMSSSRDTIRSAYRSRMTEYHPDKVAHLGEELQELAHQKVLEIQKAYQQLKK